MESPICQPLWLWPRAAYIHVPFCAHHCCYCDFAVAAGQDDLRDRYLDALERELEQLEEPQPVDTLFIGGGTPTHLQSSQLERLLTTLRKWLPPNPGYEWSIEANPTSIDAEKIVALAEHGVNRISLGVQSFQPHLLEFLERDHSGETVFRAVELVRRKITNISLDLIFGVPGQTVKHWEDDLRTALSLEPVHLSTYGLTYEKGTRLWKDRERGRVQPLQEETELDMYLRAMDVLESAGFEQYEISSFARPGKTCRHNHVYWANHAYFGFGMGAARYVNGRREVNTRDLQTYLRKISSGQSAVFQSEELAPEERARETLALNLRRTEGICRSTFIQQTGFSIDKLAGKAIAKQIANRLLEDDDTSVRLTRKGKCLADSVIESLL